MGCWDLAACNFDESAVQECVDCCIYPEQNYDCDGVCLLNVDCFGICGGDAIFDACGVCDGPGPQVWYYDSNNDNIPDPNVPAYIDCDDPGLFWIDLDLMKILFMVVWILSHVILMIPQL